MLRSRVVLPQPLGPSRATSAPAGTASSTPRSTWASPNAFARPVTTTGLGAPLARARPGGHQPGSTYRPAAARSPIARSAPSTAMVSWPAAGSERITSTSVPGTSPCS